MRVIQFYIRRFRMCLLAIGISCSFLGRADAIDPHADFPFGSDIKISESADYQSVAPGDMDRDGDTDIVAGIYSGNSIVWFQNNDNGTTFTRRVIDGAASRVISVKAADLDGDGDPDVISANAGSQVLAWYENLGTKTPTFTKHVISIAEADPTDVVAADLDGDGDLDVIEAKNTGENIVWFENDGNRPPAFKRRVIENNLDGAVCVAAADLNKDGAPDLAASSATLNKIMVYLSSGGKAPTFTPMFVSDQIAMPVKVGAADFNADGKMDLFVFGQLSAEIDWFKNGGTTIPSYTRNLLYMDNQDRGRAAVSTDVDLDGRPDIVASGSWMRNEGDSGPTFHHYVISDSPVLNFVARIDGDRYPDLVYAHHAVYWAKNRYRRTEDLKPENWAPQEGETVGLYPRLAIDDPDYMSVYTHIATQWHVSTKPDFSTLAWDSNFSQSGLNQIMVKVELQPNTTYYFRARRQFTDKNTPWSDATSFRTIARKITISNVPGQYATIQGAINAAATGSEIVVPRGHYTENINLKGKSLTLRSENPSDWNTVAATIIDGNYRTATVAFAGTENASCRLAGFTIQRGWAMYGAGVFGNGCHALIERNVIMHNIAADGAGGGMSHCQGIIQNNQIVENGLINSRGGGLFYCNGEIRNNVIRSNGIHNPQQNTSWGGGLADCKGSIHNNQITDNIATTGGGLSGCQNIRANIIRGNYAYSDGGGLDGCLSIGDNLIDGNAAYIGGALLHCADVKNCTIVRNTTRSNNSPVYDCTGPLVNCIVWDVPTTVCITSFNAEYSCVQRGAYGTGNITSDPQFVNAAAGDFRLKSTSPCIDAGKDSGTGFDINGAPHGVLVVGGRGDGSNYDMGAYEYIPNDILVNAPQGNFLTGTQIRVTGWFYTPTVGDTVRIELWRGGQKVVVLGEVYSPSGSIDQVFTLPVLASGSYQLRAISLVNPALSDASDNLIVITFKNAVRGGWQLYR
ncbi:FG-GAP-like repeat-containing protein [bacterium]|nr:FG-GAP-like repeat-containing protein [bacterium]